MRRFALPALALLAATTAALPAMARDNDRCPRVARENWMPIDQVVSRVQQMGYTAEEIGRDDGCWEIEARDRNGVKVEFKLDPVSGALVTRQGGPAAKQ